MFTLEGRVQTVGGVEAGDSMRVAVQHVQFRLHYATGDITSSEGLGVLQAPAPLPSLLLAVSASVARPRPVSTGANLPLSQSKVSTPTNSARC